MEGPGTYFKIQRLQHDASAICPELLQGQHQSLKCTGVISRTHGDESFQKSKGCNYAGFSLMMPQRGQAASSDCQIHWSAYNKPAFQPAS